MNGSVKSTILTYVIVCAVALLTAFAATHSAKACTFSVSFVDKDYAEIDEISLAPITTTQDAEVTYAFRVKVAASQSTGQNTVSIRINGEEAGTVTLLAAEAGADYRYSELIVCTSSDSVIARNVTTRLLDDFNDATVAAVWSSSSLGGSLSESDGKMSFTTGNDNPWLTWTDASTPIDASTYKALGFNLKMTAPSAYPTYDLNISWTNYASGNGNVTLTDAIIADGEFHTYTADISEEGSWDSADINTLTFDAAVANKRVDIDEVWVEDSEGSTTVDNFTDDITGWAKKTANHRDITHSDGMLVVAETSDDKEFGVTRTWSTGQFTGGKDLKIRMRVQSHEGVIARWGTSSMSLPAIYDGEFHEYVMPLHDEASWTGSINSFEIQMASASGVACEMDWIEVRNFWGTEEDGNSDSINYFVVQQGETIEAQCGTYVSAIMDTTYIQEPPQNALVDGYGVLVHSGEFVKSATDLSFPGVGLDFAFTRTYRSFSTYTDDAESWRLCPLGNKWDFNYNMRMKKIDIYHDNEDSSTSTPLNTVIRLYNGGGRIDQYTIVKSSGSVVTYDPPAAEYDNQIWKFYEAPAGIFNEIVEVLNSTTGETLYYLLRTKNRTDIKFVSVQTLTSLSPDGDKDEVVDYAMLKTITDRNGNKIEVHYNNDDDYSRIDYIEDSRGDEALDLDGVHVKFIYNTEGPNIGRISKIFIDEDGNGALDAGEDYVWQYYYDGNGDLTSVETPETKTYATASTETATDASLAVVYGYGDDHFLTHIYEPLYTEMVDTQDPSKGWKAKTSGVAALHNSYEDEYDRVSEQQTYGKGKYKFDYSEIAAYQVTVKNPLANVETSDEYYNPNAKTVYVLNHDTVPYYLGLAQSITVYDDSDAIGCSNPIPCVSRFGYNSDYQMTCAIYPEGNSKEYDYDSTAYNPSSGRQVSSGHYDFSDLSKGSVTKVRAVDEDGDDKVFWCYAYEKAFNQLQAASKPRYSTATYVNATSSTDWTVLVYDYELSEGYKGNLKQVKSPVIDNDRITLATYGYTTKGRVETITVPATTDGEETVTTTKYEYFDDSESDDVLTELYRLKRVTADEGTGKINMVVATIGSYDVYGTAVTVTDWKGGVTFLGDTDALGSYGKVTMPGDYVQSLKSDPNGNTLHIETTNGKETINASDMAYDVDNLLKESDIKGLDRENDSTPHTDDIEVERDGAGNIREKAGPTNTDDAGVENYSTPNRYKSGRIIDARGFVVESRSGTQTENPISVKYSRNKNGYITKIESSEDVDSTTRTVQSMPDKLGRPFRTMDPIGRIKEITYGNGVDPTKIVAVTLYSGGTLEAPTDIIAKVGYDYDALGRMDEVATYHNPTGTWVVYKVDKAIFYKNGMVKETIEDADSTTFSHMGVVKRRFAKEYDNLGRTTREISYYENNDSRSEEMHYDYYKGEDSKTAVGDVENASSVELELLVCTSVRSRHCIKNGSTVIEDRVSWTHYDSNNRVIMTTDPVWVKDTSDTGASWGIGGNPTTIEYLHDRDANGVYRNITLVKDAKGNMHWTFADIAGRTLYTAQKEAGEDMYLLGHAYYGTGFFRLYDKHSKGSVTPTIRETLVLNQSLSLSDEIDEYLEQKYIVPGEVTITATVNGNPITLTDDDNEDGTGTLEDAAHTPFGTIKYASGHVELDFAAQPSAVSITCDYARYYFDVDEGTAKYIVRYVPDDYLRLKYKIDGCENDELDDAPGAGDRFLVTNTDKTVYKYDYYKSGDVWKTLMLGWTDDATPVAKESLIEVKRDLLYRPTQMWIGDDMQPGGNFDDPDDIRLAQSFEYSDLGPMTAAHIHDGASSPNIVSTVSYDLDSLGRPQSETSGGRTVSYGGWDRINRLSGITYAGGTQLVYDYGTSKLGRIKDLKVKIDDVDKLVASYDYIGISRVDKRHVYNNPGDADVISRLDVNYVNDSAMVQQFLNAITDDGGQDDYDVSAGKFEYGYDVLHRRTWKQDVDTSKYEVYNYDDRSRLSGVKYDVTTTPPSGDTYYTGIAAANYGRETVFNHDVLGNRDGDGTDSIYGVKDDIDGDNSFDLLTSYLSNAVNQYTTVGSASPKYDAWGNLVDNGTDQYVWDHTGKLTTVKQGANTLAEMDYDALGRRISKNGAEYAWSGWQCTEEYATLSASSGVVNYPSRIFVYGNNIDELLQMRVPQKSAQGALVSVDVGDKEVEFDLSMGFYVDDDWLVGAYIAIWDADTQAHVYEIAGNDEIDGGVTLIELTDNTDLGEYTNSPVAVIIYQKQYDHVYTYHADAQGNIVAISAEDGTILEKYAYDVYGRLTYAGIWDSGTQQYDAVTTSGGFVDMGAYYAASSIGNEIFFQGRRWDNESGLYYFRNRYYDPATGRFISRDPSGPVDGPNLYAFVNNNPMNYVDPMGLDIEVTKTRKYNDVVVNRKVAAAIQAIESDDYFIFAMAMAHTKYEWVSAGTGIYGGGLIGGRMVKRQPWKSKYATSLRDAILYPGSKASKEMWKIGFAAYEEKIRKQIIQEYKKSADYKKDLEQLRAAIKKYWQTRYNFRITADINIYGNVSTDPGKRTGKQIAADWERGIEYWWNNNASNSIDGHSITVDVNVYYTQKENTNESQNRVEIRPELAKDYVSNVYKSGPLGIFGSYDRGRWAVNEPGWVVAHEFGHLAGLPDRYDEGRDNKGRRKTTPKKGYEHSIMADYRKAPQDYDMRELLEDYLDD